MVEHKPNRLSLQGIVIGLLALAGCGLLGEAPVLAQESPIAKAGDSGWFVSDPEKTYLVSTLPQGSEGRIMKPCAKVDDEGNYHLFWQVAGDEACALWHGVWRRGLALSQEKAVTTVLTEALDLGYTVTSRSGELAVAWDEFPGGAFRVREWDSERFAWDPSVALSASRGSRPAFFPRRQLLFWDVCESVPFDVSEIDPASEVSPSFQIHAATHRVRLSLCVSRITQSDNATASLVPAERVLVQEPGSGISGFDPVVYANADGTFSVFVEEVDAERQRVLRHYRYASNASAPTAAIGCWPLFSRSSEWRIFPVDDSDVYYIFWTGPRRQDDWGTHSLFWSRSDTPWVPNVLAGERYFKSGNPVAALRLTDQGAASGLVAWRSGPSETTVCRLVERGWSAPVTLPIGSTSHMALALDGEQNGVLFAATRRELRAIPFKVRWK